MIMLRIAGWILLVCMALGWSETSVLGAGPEIFSISPDEASAGSPILIRGKHLKDTKRVVFAAGPVVKTAQFKELSDRELEVIAPEFLLDGTEATVAVLTTQGVTVGMPPNAETIDPSSSSRSRSAPFSLVKNGGLLGAAQGITVIEDGGIVQGTTSAAGMAFVRQGGILLGFNNPEGVVFEERGATVNPQADNIHNRRLTPQPTYVPVDHISVSRGISPFRFKTPDQAPGPAESAPRIESIEPIISTYGSILDIHGSGFLGTSEVYVSNALHIRPTLAGFQVVSDQHLKVEAPAVNGSARPSQPMDLLHPNRQWRWPFAPVRPHFLIVVNSRGATVTVPAGPTGQAISEVYDLFQYVGPGQTSTIDHSLYFVDADGLATQPAGIVFLKNGARLATTSTATVFLEPQAHLPAALDNPRTSHRVESLHASPLRRMPVILNPYR